MISVKQLHYRYAGAPQASLDQIDLRVERGRLFGLLGPNGAGKTTLLSIISGKRRAPPGTVWVDGNDIATSKTSWQDKISLVPQEFAFYDRLTVRENLTFFSGIAGLHRSDTPARIQEVVAISGLNERLDQRAATLSGGLKRRLNLAIGLLNRPRLLLLDEPTVGIDPHSRHFILATIKALNAQGTTIVYTSHYMTEVEALCDELAIMDRGKILKQGSMTELLDADSSEVLTVELNTPLTPDQHGSLNLGDDFNPDSKRIFIDVNDHESLYSAMRKLESLNIKINRMHFGARNLEELFLNLTHRSLRDQ